nr:hypothetical protein [Bacteroidota bacterium]
MKRQIEQILFSFLILVSLSCYSQNARIDSLTSFLKSATVDTAKVNTLNELFLEYERLDPA